MIGRVGWHKGCGLAAMIAAIAVPGATCAQEAPPQTPAPAPVPPAESPMLDPDSPLAPLPELGVDWPDLGKVDATATDDTAKTDIAELTRYDYRIEGIEGITDALFLQRFNSLSALKAHVGDPSNAAQIDRRAREDVTLLQTLLRGIGYYDARISTSIAAESGKPRVTLLVEPGTQYKLDTVATPGLAAAGEAAPALRDALGPRARLGQLYGMHPREAFDLFVPEGAPEGVMVFVHGGYWMRLDRSVWSGLAAGALERGWAVVMPSYPRAPEAPIARITEAIGAAVTRAAALVDGPVRLVGHSAGGHLVSRMLCDTGPLPDHVAARIAKVVSISGLHDLRPFLSAPEMNATLQLTQEMAAAESPALAAPPPAPSQSQRNPPT